MGIFDCSMEMASFHNEKVRLKKPEQDAMRSRRNAGRTRLRSGLEKAGFAIPDFFSQGSYAMHTMVQDDECDYDIDDGAYFPENGLQDENGTPLDAKASRERICRALQQDERLKEPAEVHTNCVRQKYPEGYHIDVPVYRVKSSERPDGSGEESIELASNGEWVVSDARGVTGWFNDAVQRENEKYSDDGQLRRIVCLTKAFARSRKEWKKETCSGIIITRLVVDEFVGVEGRDDQALIDIWKRVRSRLQLSTHVAHPVNDGDLASDGDPSVVVFRDKLGYALDVAKKLSQDCTRGEARKAWDEIFNTQHFGNQPDRGNGDNSGGTRAFVGTGEMADRRDDAGGRFGLWE